VKIEVVSDENGYLGLTEDGVNDEDMLFGDGSCRTSPETFDIMNQSTDTVDIEVELLDGTIEFTDAVAGGGTDAVDIEDHLLRITGMQPGAEVSDVTIEPTGGDESWDTLSFTVFDVEGTSPTRERTATIHAERSVCLKPEEINADIRLSNINTPIKFRNLNVEPGSVTVLANGVQFGTKPVDGSDNLKIDYTDPAALGCGSSNNKINVKVEGKTEEGTPFSGEVSGVNCSN
jgi:hypothetical protein